MSLLQIGVFTFSALLIRWLGGLNKFKHFDLRRWGLMLASLLAIFWLQPALPIRYTDFWLPTLIIIITVLSWAILSTKEARQSKNNLIVGAVIVIILLMVGSTRFFSFRGILTATRPPQFWQIAILVGFSIGFYGLIWWKSSSDVSQKFVGLLAVLIGLLVVLKTPFLVEKISFGIRALIQQSPDRASGMDLRWFGFSYVVFRLIATIFDKRNRQLGEISLQDYVIYVIFFPTLSAGPIDRSTRFFKDLDTSPIHFDEDFIQAGKRVFVGMFKKFVIADTLALIALNNTVVSQINDSKWMWFVLYAYTFQILFDFSGYTDIVLGIGKLMGFTLPENFNLPYLAKNISDFWRKWHMTLSSWFRDYVFIPLEWRVRKSSRSRLYRDGNILLVFLLTGLWHGVTINFVVWGLWHGVGIVIQSRWTEWMTPKFKRFENNKNYQMISTILRVAFNFHYVALGWVWFALPSPEQALLTFEKLLGL